MMQCCGKCKFQCDRSFKFCPRCGEMLQKQCSSCQKTYLLNFNFCPDCGVELKSSPPPQHHTPKELRDERVRKESDKKVKVSILSGYAMSIVKLETGGGNRHCYINSNDDYHAAFNKISELYFPKKYNQCLGQLNDFKTNLLDFKKQVLNEESFKSLADYLDKEGLQLNRKPIFFLHITKVVHKKPFVRSCQYGAASSGFHPLNGNKPPPVATTITNNNNKTFIRVDSNGEKSTAASPVGVKSPTVKVASSVTPPPPPAAATRTTTKSLSTTKMTTTMITSTKATAAAAVGVRKRDSSSDSSITSSSTTASWTNAKKINKTLNSRISDMKSQSGSGIYPDTETAASSKMTSTSVPPSKVPLVDEKPKIKTTTTAAVSGSSKTSGREGLLSTTSSSTDTTKKSSSVIVVEQQIQEIKKEKFVVEDEQIERSRSEQQQQEQQHQQRSESYDHHRYSRKSIDSDSYYSSQSGGHYRRRDRSNEERSSESRSVSGGGGGDDNRVYSSSYSYSNNGRYYNKPDYYSSNTRPGSYHPYHNKNYNYQSERYTPTYRSNHHYGRPYRNHYNPRGFHN